MNITVFKWALSKDPDIEVEASVDGENWFDPVDQPYAGDDLFYREKEKDEKFN